MENLESRGIYFFNFQACKFMQKQYAFGKQKGKKKKNLKKITDKLEIDTSMHFTHYNADK